MNKPDWAERWNEETFDYGNQRGFVAKVGEFSNAVRFCGQKCIKEPEYGPWYDITDDVWCDECEHYHTETYRERDILVPGVYEPVPLVESDIHNSLEDWFKVHAVKCRDYVKLAEERGWL